MNNYLSAIVAYFENLCIQHPALVHAEYAGRQLAATFVLPTRQGREYLHPMKVIRLIFFTLVAIIFGAVAGVIIGGITLAAGLLMLRDAITGRSRTNHQSPIN